MKMHVAPCGMNCSLCYAYQRKKNHCAGCLAPDTDDKPNYCRQCHMKHCPEHKNTKTVLCYACKSYPCARVKHIDKRYLTKYHMSLIENLDFIRDNGIRAFNKWQSEKWTCPVCGDLISVHKLQCLTCHPMDKPKPKRGRKGK